MSNLDDPVAFSNIAVKEGTVSLTISVSEARRAIMGDLVEEVKEKISGVAGVTKVDIEVNTVNKQELKHLTHPLPGIEKVRHVVAIASGKGGVGKTSIAVNLALALERLGNRVGLLDADIYGPSVPLMLGLIGVEPKSHDVMLEPVDKFNLHVMSLGMNVLGDDAFIWRGPLVSKMIRRLLGKVNWGELDYLIVDLPPGTGDPSITIAKAIPNAHIVIVTTPQEVSLADVRRAITLFRKQNQHIVGLVENMSYFLYEETKEVIEIFGHGGGEKLSKETGLPLLQSFPIDLELRKGGDNGMPIMVSSPDAAVCKMFMDMGRQIMEKTDAKSFKAV